MKLGVLTVPLQGFPLELALDKIKDLDIDCIELGTGNYPGNAHCNPEVLLANDKAREALVEAVERRGLTITALSCHGNPLHPNKDIARLHDRVYRKTVLLAEKLGVEVICLFSGCPGDSDNARWPNWVSCAWPDDYQVLLKWQWEEIVIPYWRNASAFAIEHGVPKLALEMHPGFMVYNPKTLLALRAAIGPTIGANFDPSHLFWQGIDPIVAIRTLGAQQAIYHVHAKDVYVDSQNSALNGVLDTTPYADVGKRCWTFRTVGYGHGLSTWKEIISALRQTGYDYVISIEHEDPLASIEEGLRKAVAVLKACLFYEPPPKIWWAQN